MVVKRSLSKSARKGLNIVVLVAYSALELLSIVLGTIVVRIHIRIRVVVSIVLILHTLSVILIEHIILVASIDWAAEVIGIVFGVVGTRDSASIKVILIVWPWDMIGIDEVKAIGLIECVRWL